MTDVRACTGFDGGFEAEEAIRRLRNCVINLELKFKRRRKLRVSSLMLLVSLSALTHSVSGVELVRNLTG